MAPWRSISTFGSSTPFSFSLERRQIETTVVCPERFFQRDG
jgi:hypothetical protein